MNEVLSDDTSGDTLIAGLLSWPLNQILVQEEKKVTTAEQIATRRQIRKSFKRLFICKLN